MDFNCFKCEKKLVINDIYRCIDCQKDFCSDEGKILKESNEGINFGFLCYDCNDQISKKRDREAERKEFIRRQSERIIKEQRNEMLTKQLLHLDGNDEEKIKMPNFEELWIRSFGFRGKEMPCSGFTELHGSEWVIDMPIYLTLPFPKILLKESDLENYYKEHKAEKNYCVNCASKIKRNWAKWGLKVINDSFEKREREKKEEKIKELMQKNY